MTTRPFTDVNTGATKQLKSIGNNRFAETIVEASGEAGVRTTTNTTAVTGTTYTAIQVLEDATFTTLTENGATGQAMTGFVIPAGVVLKGVFTAYTLASGKVRAYI
jgi:sugar/nucleoside kinase (ribokinase family)